MAKAKKVQKYVPLTKYPRYPSESYHYLLQSKYTYEELLSIVDTRQDGSWGGRWTYDEQGKGDYVAYKNGTEYYTDKIDSQKTDVGNWQQINMDENYHFRNLLNWIWPMTAEFRELNGKFLAEYDSRPDMQEFYTSMAESVGYFQDVTESYTNYNRDDVAKIDSGGFRNRPASYAMYSYFLESASGRRMVELARETPYEEGDLVVLRLPFVGHPDWDPEWVSHYKQHHEGKVQPGREVARMGMLMEVTEKVNAYRAAKGSKLMKVLWFGKEDAVYIPENKIKFYERPTLKNGLKKRE